LKWASIIDYRESSSKYQSSAGYVECFVYSHGLLYFCRKRLYGNISERSEALITRVKELRIERGLKQEALADFVGSSQQTISRIENEIGNPPLDLIVLLAKYFNVTVDYILCLSNTRRSFEGQLRMDKEIDECYNVVSVYKSLSEENRKTILLVMNCLVEMQKGGGGPD